MKTKEAGKQLAKLVDAADRFTNLVIDSVNHEKELEPEEIRAFQKAIEDTRPAIGVLKNRFP